MYFSTACLVLRVVGGLALATAVDHCLAATALFELHLASRLVQLVVLAAGVGASKKAAAHLLSHVIICGHYRARHAQALLKTALDKEEHYWRFAKGCMVPITRGNDMKQIQIHGSNGVIGP